MEHEPIADLNEKEDLYLLLERARDPNVKLGLRDSHKVEKLQRISATARRLFMTSGYEGTTLREIAHEARVALGTLGFYADDKRDLIVLIFNRDIPQLIEAGRARLQRSQSDVEQLLDFFHPFYHRYASEPNLYRILLRENLHQGRSMHGREFMRLRAEIIATVREILVGTRREQPAEIIDRAAKGLFFIYFAQVRWWISTDEPDAKEGLLELEMLFRTHISGIQHCV